MKWLSVVVVVFPVVLSGCGFLGFYRHQRAERASLEEAEKVKFPNSFEKGDHLMGPRMAAIRVAMDEFMPPGTKVKGDNPQLAQCLSQWETYDVAVLQSTENLFFVSFLPITSRCGLDAMVFDAGAVYAVDARGRIVAEE